MASIMSIIFDWVRWTRWLLDKVDTARGRKKVLSRPVRHCLFSFVLVVASVLGPVDWDPVA